MSRGKTVEAVVERKLRRPQQENQDGKKRRSCQEVRERQEVQHLRGHTGVVCDSKEKKKYKKKNTKICDGIGGGFEDCLKK
jgi:hypothetical protein